VTEVALCGLPGPLWTAAAGPELFALAARLDADADRGHADAGAVAARIGADASPPPAPPT
jgi:hypothetical protein